MKAFAIVRLSIFRGLVLFSLTVLGLAANLTANTFGWTFPGFAVAVSVLTLLALVPMLVIDLVRTGSFISWVAIELGVFGVLWVLWLSSAALSTSTLLFTGDCGFWDPFLASLCRQYSAVQAFLWLGWLAITAYIILLLVLAILATTRGHKRVWLGAASDLDFSPTSIKASAPYGVSPAGTATAGYPPNQYGGQYQQQPVMQQHGTPYGQQQGYIPSPQQTPHPGSAQV